MSKSRLITEKAFNAEYGVSIQAIRKEYDVNSAGKNTAGEYLFEYDILKMQVDQFYRDNFVKPMKEKLLAKGIDVEVISKSYDYFIKNNDDYVTKSSFVNELIANNHKSFSTEYHRVKQSVERSLVKAKYYDIRGVAIYLRSDLLSALNTFKQKKPSVDQCKLNSGTRTKLAKLLSKDGAYSLTLFNRIKTVIERDGLIPDSIDPDNHPVYSVSKIQKALNKYFPAA